jgi:hypothetical protein
VEQFAGIVLLFLATVLFINLVQGGPAQVKANLRAKFLGHPLGA